MEQVGEESEDDFELMCQLRREPKPQRCDDHETDKERVRNRGVGYTLEDGCYERYPSLGTH